MGDFTGIFFVNLLAGKNFSHYILALCKLKECGRFGFRKLEYGKTKIAILFGKSSILCR